jgi:hypothetical protein
MTNFGYSTIATSQNGRVILPKSRPWNAPEHHFRELTVTNAKKTDIYSFGMLYLWILAYVPIWQSSTEYMLDASVGPCISLENLKHSDKLEEFACQLMESVPLAGLDV